MNIEKQSGYICSRRFRQNTPQSQESRLQPVAGRRPAEAGTPGAMSRVFAQTSSRSRRSRQDAAVPAGIPPAEAGTPGPLKCRHFVVGTRFCASAAHPNAGNAVLEQRPLPILPTAFHGDPAKTSTPERTPGRHIQSVCSNFKPIQAFPAGCRCPGRHSAG
jgi:hypothetical protein